MIYGYGTFKELIESEHSAFKGAQKIYFYAPKNEVEEAMLSKAFSCIDEFVNADPAQIKKAIKEAAKRL